MGGVKENDMAERLTKKISKTIQNKYSLGSYLYYDFAEIDDTNKLLNKLGRLEDILEKYGIESVEELDYLLEVFKKMRKEYGKLNQENYKNKKDRDTWKRACELACKWFKQTGFIGDQTKVDYYYQQAKKEGENNDTNN